MKITGTTHLVTIVSILTLGFGGCFEEESKETKDDELRSPEPPMDEQVSKRKVPPEQVPELLVKDKKDKPQVDKGKRQGGRGKRHKAEEGELDDLLGGGSPSPKRRTSMARASSSSPGSHYGIRGPISGKVASSPRPRPRTFNTEGYDHQEENGFKMVSADPLSTFSIDVDTASYSNVRRFLNRGEMPPKGAVRIEELINYFTYNYPQPTGDAPFACNVEIASCPWNEAHRLVRIGLKGKVVENKDRKPANLVFLLDVSGSMSSSNKLPLLKRAFKLAVSKLNVRDRVAIVVYAGASGLALPSTTFDNKTRILDALNNLQAGGSTNAGDGIHLAYKIAKQNFIKGGTNRVILATDGDFNVGVTSQSDLVDLVKDKAKDGVFLTVLGFGMGNYKDDMLEKLADKGNGNYGYIDTFQEARKLFSEQISGTLETIAKDVKIQVEFNPAKVGAYRLVGYENRMLAAQDFNDDKKDAGEIGAGHTVTALYQVVPKGVKIGVKTASVDPLKYQQNPPLQTESSSDELLTLKLRYKAPDANVSKKLEFPIQDFNKSFESASSDFRFQAAVASFGMLVRNSEFKAGATYGSTIALAEKSRGQDSHGYRTELLKLIRTAKDLSPGKI